MFELNNVKYSFSVWYVDDFYYLSKPKIIQLLVQKKLKAPIKSACTEQYWT